MIKLKQLIKRNLYVSITIIVLFLSITSASVVLAVFSEANTVDRTSVGFIYLGNSEENKYSSIIETQVNAWQDDASYNVIFQGYTYSLNLNMFEFDIESTLNHLVIDQDNQAHFTLSDSNKINIFNALEQKFSSAIISMLDRDALINQVLSDMQHLFSRKTYDLSVFLDENIALYVIDTTTISNIAASDVNTIMDALTEFQIPEKSRFSLLNQIGNLNLNNEQLSIIASGLQGITLNTSFTGFVFEQHYIAPAWVIPGQNARILRVNQFDFTFYNPMNYDFRVSISKLSDTSLGFSLHGVPYITTYSSEATVQTIIPFQTTYIENPLLNALTENIIVIETDDEYIYRLLIRAGVNGQVVFYNRTTTVSGLDPVTIKLFHEQYLPIEAIYEEFIINK